jgi:very-short-patch-repair endonuclease
MEPAVGAWIARLCEGRDLVHDALAWLSRRDGRTVQQRAASVGRMTPYELDSYLESALPATSPAGVEMACRLILKMANGPVRLDPSALMERLDAELAEQRPGGGAALSALRGLVLPGSDPVLLLAHSGQAPVTAAWAVAAARLLSALAEIEPGLALVLAVSARDFDVVRRVEPGSRASALLGEAVVEVLALDADAVYRRIDEPPGRARDLDGSVRRLVDDGVTPELVALFHEAAGAVADAARPELDPATGDRARSAAERFLYERLESLPETSGVFRLNGRIDVQFGAGAMEVDLLADALRLAVEIDGYHHFRDADAYRRDRRKDLELQRAGYLVVRVLADDVVRRLEDVLETTLSAVATRRRRERTEERS